MLGVLIIAWILSWLDFDEIVVDGMNEVFGTEYTTNTYWFIAAVIGVIVEIICYIRCG